jgi:hypothetical protein
VLARDIGTRGDGRALAHQPDMDFLQSINDTAFSSWIRESDSLLAYPAFITLHTAGLAVLVGINAIANALILTSSPGRVIAPVARFFPLMWTAFAINALTGLALVAADATTMVLNPVMWVKLSFVAVAIALMCGIQLRVFSPALASDPRPVDGTGKALAVLSFVCWFGAIAAGRLTAYLGPVAGVIGG